MISHHPNQNVLMAYVAGNSSEATALIVATHATLCAACREKIRLGEALGGAMLNGLPPTPMSGAPPEDLGERTGKAQSPPSSSSLSHNVPRGKAPGPLRDYLNGDLGEVRWRPFAPGLAYRVVIPGRRGARLVRARPGAAIAMHTHRGAEFSLVLAGGYKDGSGQYLRGDFQAADSNLLHRPLADDGEDCVLLIVSEAPLVFGNPLVGLMAKMIGC